MLRKTLLIIVTILLTSCSFKTISYTHEFNTFQKGIDFKQASGNWLLNTMNLPEREEGSLEKIAFNKFSDWTHKKIVKKENMKDKKGKKAFFNIPYHPNTENLIFINQTTNYKHLVNIYLERDTNNRKLQESEIFIDVYDIAKKKIILSERVVGFMDKEKGTDIGDSFKIDVIPGMMSRLLKKGLKKIEENSTFN